MRVMPIYPCALTSQLWNHSSLRCDEVKSFSHETEINYSKAIFWKAAFFFSVNPRKETSKYIWTISSYYMFTFHNFLKTRSLQEVLRWNLFHPVKQIIKGNIEKQLSGQSIQKQRVNKGPLCSSGFYTAIPSDILKAVKELRREKRSIYRAPYSSHGVGSRSSTVRACHIYHIPTHRYKNKLLSSTLLQWHIRCFCCTSTMTSEK